MPTSVRTALFALLCSIAVTLGSGPPAGAAAAVACTQDWRPAPTASSLTAAGTPTDPPQPLPAPPSPAHRPFHVFCDGHYVATVWLATPTTLLEAVRVARELAGRAVYPSVGLGVNPARGLTGLESWFWAEPDADPLRLLPGNGPPIALELRVGTVRFTFGDAPAAPIAGLGAKFPAPSPVAHLYERKGSYRVTAQVVVTGRYWYEELQDATPPATHTVTVRHDVAEVRSLLHAA